jgi:hypothetical protein
MTQQEIANAEAFKRTQLNALIELEKKMYYNSFVVNCPQDKTGVADLLRDDRCAVTSQRQFENKS